ncbi:MAG TPA: FG-GAP repeat protein [Terriglobales bacterium]|jgi:hypothetical protein|nr:FG-GAP repeat protein [Terriglobales bacterium]
MTQTAELTASDAQANDLFGCSVAISGNAIVVGASAATVNGNPNQGAAYVFVMPTDGWTNMTETAKLTASDGSADASFGSGSAINGNTVIVGAPFVVNGNVGPGTAYVFVMPSGGWTDMTQTAELTASDGTDQDYFGYSVSVSGNVAIVGARQVGQRPGVTYVFAEPGTGWTNATETAELTASDGVVGDAFGTSVSLSGDTAVVGAQYHGADHGAGAVYVFVKPPNGWANMTQTAELTVSGGKPTCFGTSVSISGEVILGGAECAHESEGAAFVFVEPDGGWQNTSKYKLRLSISFSYQGDLFGGSVAISGTTGIIGAPYAPTSPPCGLHGCQLGPGEAFVFVK